MGDDSEVIRGGRIFFCVYGVGFRVCDWDGDYRSFFTRVIYAFIWSYDFVLLALIIYKLL